LGLTGLTGENPFDPSEKENSCYNAPHFFPRTRNWAPN
jgi:hypothetical protein